ncbi:periplasmic heavy metal sensor [Spirosoma flavum]|uniref:Periplasmic heavy metal sensor n=1 Tax=Spirosoma flavum TaxID=2048557 RepID=A0ABW6AC48_9BACT
MERTKLLTIAVIGLLLLNLLTVGLLVVKPMSFWPPHPDHRPEPPSTEGPAAIIIERLHFNSDQQKLYRQLVTSHQNQTRLLNDQMAQLYRDYYGLLASVQPNSERANALSEQIASNQQAQAELNFDHFKQIRRLCRPGQQVSFNNLVRDLARLFSRQHPPRPHADGPLTGPSENLPHQP